MTILCKEIYTKYEVDNMITNRDYRIALYDLVVVPKELATVIEVELDDGFVIAKQENTISTKHTFKNEYLMQKIEEHRPDIICASDSSTLDSVPLQSIRAILNKN